MGARALGDGRADCSSGESICRLVEGMRVVSGRFCGLC
jgi:hypothetical protein